MALLEIEGLSVSYQTESGPIRAVRDFSVSLAAGESLALVGETGSGKSTVALALMGLLGEAARIDSGEIRFDGIGMSAADRRTWQQVRGGRIGMIFQDTRGALNPVLTIGSQLVEAMRAHQRLTLRGARAMAVEMLSEAGIPDPPFFMRRYPLELSGGLCQRAALAIALCNRPALLVADEPTSALDPSIQAQILQLLRRLREGNALAMLLISHDLALVSEVSDWVAVMYHGRIVEFGRTSDVLRRPAHPYSAALIQCQADLEHHWDRRPLSAIAGSPPASGEEFTGCSFAPRCPSVDAACSKTVPLPVTVSDGHRTSCFREVGR